MLRTSLRIAQRTEDGGTVECFSYWQLASTTAEVRKLAALHKSAYRTIRGSAQVIAYLPRNAFFSKAPLLGMRSASADTGGFSFTLYAPPENTRW